MRLLRYFAQLRTGKIVLWCYLIWYLINVAFHFDPDPSLWLNSVGIALVMGIALKLGVAAPAGAKPDPWHTIRIFLMPFCVSSFASQIKGQGYILVFPTELSVLAASVGGCMAFVLVVYGLSRWVGKQ
jgi:hypothetical protein